MFCRNFTALKRLLRAWSQIVLGVTLNLNARYCNFVLCFPAVNDKPPEDEKFDARGCRFAEVRQEKGDFLLNTKISTLAATLTKMKKRNISA